MLSLLNPHSSPSSSEQVAAGSRPEHCLPSILRRKRYLIDLLSCLPKPNPRPKQNRLLEVSKGRREEQGEGGRQGEKERKKSLKSLQS